MSRRCRVGQHEIGSGRKLAILAGPCVLESLDLGLEIGRHVHGICRELGLTYIFKASFDKANRSSIHSARGPGLQKGLDWIRQIGSELKVPVTTDIHEPGQAALAAAAVDLLQIPAFLSRQTDLLLAAGHAAAQHGRAVNVKKGQFMAPWEMAGAIRKLLEAGCRNAMLTDRGTFFGYGRLVNDFVGLGDMLELDIKGVDANSRPAVCLDVTHSMQTPGTGETTGGRPERAPLLARAAAAAGVDALFIECHPEPSRGMSDASTMLRLDSMSELLGKVARVRAAIEA